MKINIYKILPVVTLVFAFILPTRFFQNWLGYDLVEYLFLVVSVLMYAIVVSSEKKIYLFELLTFVTIILICMAQKSVYPLFLLELLVAYRFSNYYANNNIKINRNLIILCVLGVAIYSLVYSGYAGRYIYTGLREVNQSGFAVFMLFIIVRKYNKKIGDLLLLLGLFTFSRNYLLCLIIYFVLDKIKNKQFFIKISKYINFRNLALLSFVLLIFLSSLFTYAYENNKIGEYQQGWNRYLTLFDYSNYARFTVNAKLIDIYISYPSYLLTGIEDEKFYDLSYKIGREKGILYKPIKPHNYFFSYLRIYGIFSLIIFIIIGKIIGQLVNKNNISILILLFIYADFLGIGLANYWLFLSMIVMALYRKDEVKYI